MLHNHLSTSVVILTFPSSISLLRKKHFFLVESFTYKKHGSQSNSSLVHIEHADLT